MTTDNKEPIKPDNDNPDLTGTNEAGNTKTTSKEYVKRERGKQNVPPVPVGNPVENVENDPDDQPENSSKENESGDRSSNKA